MNKVISNLTLQNYRDFKFSFENSKDIFWNEELKKLHHPGEYGGYRELLAKRWLSMYTPERYGIGSGFVITEHGTISTQADLIIYDKFSTPKIESVEHQRFFPIETVIGIGEIKSDITSNLELSEYLRKLSKFKMLRDEVKNPSPVQTWRGIPYQPQYRPFDNIFTFLICNKLNYDYTNTGIAYNDIEQRYKHNMVLSLQDGLLSYKTSGLDGNLFFPFMGDELLIPTYLNNDDSELPKPVLMFVSYYHMLVKSATVLEIDMVSYLFESPLDNLPL